VSAFCYQSLKYTVGAVSFLVFFDRKKKLNSEIMKDNKNQSRKSNQNYTPNHPPNAKKQV
jgi:hypothetical protein